MTIGFGAITIVSAAFVLGSSGTALAQSDNAAGVQYQPEERTTVTIVPPETPPPPPPEVAPPAPEVVVPPPVEQPQPEVAHEAGAPEIIPTVVKPKVQAVTGSISEPDAPTAQVAAVASQGGLPVTGYNVLPVALGGLVLLLLGGVLRRQTRRSS